MKYAKEILDLMPAYPGRKFRLVELVRHVSKGRAICQTEKTRLQRGIQRVMVEMARNGSVSIHEPEKGGHGRQYEWNVTVPSHRAANNVTRSVTYGLSTCAR